jgi:hypothetical protein
VDLTKGEMEKIDMVLTRLFGLNTASNVLSNIAFVYETNITMCLFIKCVRMGHALVLT